MPRTLAVIQFGAGMLYEDSLQVVAEADVPIDVVAVSTGNSDTIADKIHDASQTWQTSVADLRNMGKTTSRKDGSPIYHVSENEIIEALGLMGSYGVPAEPSGAAGLAIVPRIEDIVGKKYELIAVINTGDGLQNIR